MHYTQMAVIIRAPHVIDRYGNATPEHDWIRATKKTVRRVSVQPDASTEDPAPASPPSARSG
ncbi:hypothetical protein ACIQCR_12570 [Streptomyces sp. NPDC093249]|uniref:hypothetical protein n=1 Tax=unclassified Streptomyces TaxID=2593676 RepID=UPI00345073F3